MTKKTTTHKHLKTSIVVDPYGAMEYSGTEEADAHKRMFTALLHPLKLTVDTPLCFNEDSTSDLIVFDFGGMGFGNDLLGDNSRRLCRWANDHPSSLCLIVSDWTFRHGVLREMQALGMFVRDVDEPPSVYEDDPPPTIELQNVKLFKHYERSQCDAVRAWFNLPKLTSSRWLQILNTDWKVA